MLDKRKATRMTKIVSLLLAISFAAMYVPMLTGVGRSSAPTQATNGTAVNDLVKKPTGDLSKESQIESLVGQGDFSLGQKNYPQAANYYQQALDLDVTNPKVTAKLGQALYLSGDFTGATSKLSEAIKLDPKAAAAYFYLAQTYRAANNTQAAVDNYTGYLKLEPQGEHVAEANAALAELKK